MPEPLTSISRNTNAVLIIEPGDSIELRVEDWCHGLLSADPATYGVMSRPRCPIAGPIDIRGAQVGDHVAVLVERITLDTRGTAARIRDVGPLAPPDGRTRVWDVQRNGEWVELAGLRFAVASMIGIIGVRPDCEEPLGTRYTGKYGGNLDTREIAAGTTVELPVLTPGAGLFVGDVHAAMGDGELTATGCEFGANVQLRVNLVKDQPIPGPRIRFGQVWATLATSQDFRQAMKDAVHAMQQWIMKERDLDEAAAAFVIGMAGGIGISQVVNPSGMTVKATVDWRRVMLPSIKEKRG
jgi:amidase